MASSEYRIRPMTRADLATAVDWAAAEGWNPGLGDADCYWQADPEGFYMGVLNGTPVSSISVVKYGSSFAFLGFYIVAPGHRGKGLGLALWRHAMATAGDRNIGLDGVVDQQDNYKKSGFTLALRNIRFQGNAMGSAGGPPESGPASGTIVPLNQVPVKEVLAFDSAFFPEDRALFIKKWISQPGADIFLDVPEPNGPAIELARSRGMTPCFETARMYTGPFPDLPLDRIFGITSFEVG